MKNKLKKFNIKEKNFLDEIVKKKKEDLQVSAKDIQSVNKSGTTDFRDAVTTKKRNKTALIAEIKFASPTNKNLGSPDDLLTIARTYKKAETDAISIITEKHFFNGDISYVSQVKKEVNMPVLQKDFVIEPSQIYEAKDIGSDALLLIARLVSSAELEEFVDLCFSLGIEPVVEIANEEDLEKAIMTKTNIIAVNARDLETFAIDIAKACLLLERIPKKFIALAFSGVSSKDDVEMYRNAGAAGVLVGTNLMRTGNVKKFITDLHL